MQISETGKHNIFQSRREAYGVERIEMQQLPIEQIEIVLFCCVRARENLSANLLQNRVVAHFHAPEDRPQAINLSLE